MVNPKCQSMASKLVKELLLDLPRYKQKIFLFTNYVEPLKCPLTLFLSKLFWLIFF